MGSRRASYSSWMLGTAPSCGIAPSHPRPEACLGHSPPFPLPHEPQDALQPGLLGRIHLARPASSLPPAPNRQCSPCRRQGRRRARHARAPAGVWLHRTSQPSLPVQMQTARVPCWDYGAQCLGFQDCRPLIIFVFLFEARPQQAQSIQSRRPTVHLCKVLFLTCSPDGGAAPNSFEQENDSESGDKLVAITCAGFSQK